MVTSRLLSSFFLRGIIVIPTCTGLVCAIPEVGIVIFGHVLKDDLTSQVWMSHATAMLMMPLNVELWTLVELHGTLCGTFDGDIIIVVFVLAGWLAVISDLVSGRCVVLRVKQPVCVLHVVALFTKLVVGSSWTVQVHVRIGRPDRCEQQGRNYSEGHDCHGSKWWRQVLPRDCWAWALQAKDRKCFRWCDQQTCFIMVQSGQRLFGLKSEVSLFSEQKVVQFHFGKWPIISLYSLKPRSMLPVPGMFSLLVSCIHQF